MIKLWKRIGMSSLAALCFSCVAEEHAQIDADGTLHTPPLSIPPSEYWSVGFRKAYIKAVQSHTRSNEMPNIHASESAWQAFYAACDRSFEPLVAQQLARYSVNVLDTKIAGVSVSILTPKGGIAPQNQHRVLIHLHGGGCRGTQIGQFESVPIAAAGRIKVITVDYRPAPHNRYSDSVEDVLAVYRVLSSQYAPQAIGIFGNSVGGMLVSQAVVAFQAERLPRPGAVGIFWTGLLDAPLPFGKWGDSMLWGTEAVLQSDRLAYFKMVTTTVGAWLRGADSNDPMAYPGSSDERLAKFPPTLLLSGTRAHEMSGAIDAHVRLLELGVDASLYIMEGGWHGASIGADGTPEAQNANAYVTRWFASHLHTSINIGNQIPR